MRRMRNCMKLYICSIWHVFLFTIDNIVVEARGGSGQIKLRTEYRNLCGQDVPPVSKNQARILSWMVDASGDKSILMKSSPQHEAACWMLYQDPIRKYYRNNEKQFLQRYALVTLYFGTKGPETWEGRPSGTIVLSTQRVFTANKQPAVPAKPDNTTTENLAVYPLGNSWLSASHECTWYGISCNFFKRVIGLELGSHGLDNMIPRELYLLTNLRELELYANELQGVLPNKALMNWKNVKTLRLQINSFLGSIPEEIGHMKKLEELTLFGNYIFGKIPKSLSSIKNLREIDLFANMITGTVPSTLGKLKSLRKLDVHDNDLVGTMPKEICDLKLDALVADCLGPNPEIRCDCCTVCCRGLPDAKCVEKATGKTVLV